MKKIVLHACCAPCASYPIQKLIEDNYEPVVFFYNPNIYPFEEYKIRRDELKKYTEKLNLAFFEENYEPELFTSYIKGLENEPEKGSRCSKCFKLRLEKTAQFALQNNINCFTTTLTVSPHKNSNQIFEIANEISNQYKVEFLNYNFKKQDGFKISRKIAKENSMYTQTYCGCKYSITHTQNLNNLNNFNKLNNINQNT